MTKLHSSHFQPFLAISYHSNHFCHFQPFLAIPALSRHFQPFQPYPAISSHSSHFQPFPAISSHFSHFQPYPVISTFFSHLQVVSHLTTFAPKGCKIAAAKKVFYRFFLLDLFTPFKSLFAPASQSPMSKLFRFLKSVGISNEKKWSQICKLLLIKGAKLLRKKKQD